MSMAITKKTCAYILLSVCILGVVLGIILVLVFIQLLVVPLQGKQPMLHICQIVSISPITPGTPSEHTVGQDYGGKIRKLSKMENEIIVKDKAKESKENDSGEKKVETLSFRAHKIRHNSGDKKHRIRHKSMHVYTSADVDDDKFMDTNTCYVVRIQFESDVSEQLSGPRKREGYLLQPLETSALVDGLLRIHTDSKCFCYGCQLHTTENNTDLVYAGGIIQHGESVSCTSTPTGSDVPRKKGVNLLLLNAMLWPTLIFILGFVGLFFVGIRIALENNMYQKRKMHTSSGTPVRLS